MFHNFAGVTPKQFLQYLSVEQAKQILHNTGASLSDTAYETGLSGSSRLHDLFVKIEGMTPGEYKNGGETLVINYSFVDSPFGRVLVAFADDGEQVAFNVLQSNFPNAKYVQLVDLIQQNAFFVFSQDWSQLDEVKLHLKGTDFQIKVWETLLTVPSGGLTTYSDLALKSGYAGASRAVGTAIGNNPVAFLIPCHRVIKATGELGQYHWGAIRKMLSWDGKLHDMPAHK